MSSVSGASDVLKSRLESPEFKELMLKRSTAKPIDPELMRKHIEERRGKIKLFTFGPQPENPHAAAIEKLKSKFESQAAQVSSDSHRFQWVNHESDDADLTYDRSIVGVVTGNGVTLNAASHAFIDVKGDNSTVNVGGFFRGGITGDNSTLNLADNGYVSIRGNNSRANVAGNVHASIDGDNVTLTANATFGGLSIKGNNATVNVKMLSALLHLFKGNGLTLNADVAVGDVTLGTRTYFDTLSGEERKSGSGSGDIKLNIGTVVGNASTGDGNDVLTIGSAKAVNGGRGDDIIKIDNAKNVAGGQGNDQIEVGAGVEEIYFERGDGHDIVTANSGTTIDLRDFGKDKVRVSVEDGTYRISFEGSDDTIELRMQDGATSTLSFGSRIFDGAIELKDGTVTYI